jgi:hypothetical protein
MIFQDIDDLDWTNSKLFKQLKSGEDLNYELNENAHSSLDSHNESSRHPLRAVEQQPVIIFSSIESTYFSGLLKCKLHRKDQIVEDYTDQSLKALRTLKALMLLLLLRP